MKIWMMNASPWFPEIEIHELFAARLSRSICFLFILLTWQLLGTFVMLSRRRSFSSIVNYGNKTKKLIQNPTINIIPNPKKKTKANFMMMVIISTCNCSNLSIKSQKINTAQEPRKEKYSLNNALTETIFSALKTSWIKSSYP